MQYAHAHGHVPVRTRVINSVHTLRRTNAPESVDSEPLALSIYLSIYESIYLRASALLIPPFLVLHLGTSRVGPARTWARRRK
jgi:hypothetical protein